MSKFSVVQIFDLTEFTKRRSLARLSALDGKSGVIAVEAAAAAAAMINNNDEETAG